jgi:hypothetical protein
MKKAQWLLIALAALSIGGTTWFVIDERARLAAWDRQTQTALRAAVATEPATTQPIVRVASANVTTAPAVAFAGRRNTGTPGGTGTFTRRGGGGPNVQGTAGQRTTPGRRGGGQQGRQPGVTIVGARRNPAAAPAGNTANAVMIDDAGGDAGQEGEN